MIKCQKLIKIFKEKISIFSKDDKQIILRAFNLSKKYHKGQIYQPDYPYIIHPLMVTIKLLDWGIKDSNMICAGLLHDTVEDTNLTYHDIERLFNKEILEYVKGLTREKTSQNESEKEKYEHKKIKFLETLKKPKPIRIIKCADWLTNLSDWITIPQNHPLTKKFPRWINEVNDFYLPLAQCTDKKIYTEMLEKFDDSKKYLSRPTCQIAVVADGE